ncbi:hypothetical protein EFP86_15050, partial [Lentilactobacillus hilgardii]|nr:hypothetical protein [Lentilactobacillus hilgardii]
QLLKDGFVVNTILKEADLFCPNSVRINFTIYHKNILFIIFSGIVKLHVRCFVIPTGSRLFVFRCPSLVRNI